MRAPPLMVVAAAFAAGAGAGALLPSPPPAVGTSALVAAALGLAAAIAARNPVPALAAAAAAVGVARAVAGLGDPAEAAQAGRVAGATAILVGHIVDDVRATANGFEVLVEPEGITTDRGPATGVRRVLVSVHGPGTALPGDQVEAVGKLMLPEVTSSFDRRAYLAQRGAHLEMRVPRLDVIRHDAGLAAIPARIADVYRDGIGELVPAPHAAIAMGSVLGIRTGTPPRLRQQLIDTGLVHLLVLSGLKVAIFTRLSAAALRPLLGRGAELAVIPLLALYAMAGGSTAAAVRSAAMGGLALAGAWLGRPTHVWTSLAVCAAVMLGWRPELVADVGFQLSFAGTAAIVLLAAPIERRLAWLPGVLREPFAVTVAAQVGTVPMMAADFHVLSLAGPVANSLALPVLPLLVAAGLVLGPLAEVVDPALLRPLATLVLAAPAAWIEHVAAALDRLPSAALLVPQFPPLAGFAYYAGVAGAIGTLRSHGGRRLIAASAAIAVPVLAVGWEVVHWSVTAPHATVLEVGDGTAILATGPSGRILLGAGPSPARLADGLGAQLPPWARRLDAVAVTGAGLRRSGGLGGSGIQSATVLIPDAAMPGVAWRNGGLELAATGAGLRRVSAGQRLSLAGLTVDVLWPPAGWTDPASAALGVRVSGTRGSICDPGDVDAEVQAAEAQRLTGPCSVLVLPGGGRSAPAPELLDAARPAWLVATAGGARLARGLAPDKLRRTDLEGSLDFDL